MTEHTGNRLPRQLGVWSATTLVIGLMIGASIFRAPSVVAAHAGSPGRVAVVWATGGAIALCGALSLAELGAMFPRVGGVYAFLREAYGPAVAFLWGWTALITSPASLAALATVFAEYLGVLVPPLAGRAQVVSAVTLAGVAALSYRSTRGASGLQAAATLTKLLALAAVVTLAFALGGRAGTPDAPGPLLVAADAPTPATWGGFGLALVFVLLAYNGWQYFALMAGEVREPERVVPRALLSGVAVVCAAYLAANAAYLRVLPFAELARSPLVARDVMARAVGPAAGAAAAALIVVSAFGTLTANTLAFPRLFFAMADDGLFFRRLAAVHPRHRTPHVAVVFLAGVAAVFASARTFEQLGEINVVGQWPFLALAVLAVPVLRRRRPELRRPYRTPGYPIVPLAFVAVSLAFLANVAREHPRQTLATAGFTLLGLPVYGVWRLAHRRLVS